MCSQNRSTHRELGFLPHSYNNTQQPPHGSDISIRHHPHTEASRPFHQGPTCSAAPRSQAAYLYGSQPRLPETAIVIEYSIGEPFNRSGNGIQLRINVLCWSKRSHHHFNVQAVLKEHLACHLSRPREQNDTDFFLLCTLCECSSPNILCGYLAYFPQPSLSTSPWSRWRDTSSSTEGYCHEKPLRRSGFQPYFAPSACSVCLRARVCACVCVVVGVGGSNDFSRTGWSGCTSVYIYACLCGWKNRQAEEIDGQYGIVS